MGRSIQGFISSSTSKPTKKARNRPGWRGKEEDLLGKLVEQSETPTRELTLEEAVTLAILLQKMASSWKPMSCIAALSR